MMHGATNTMLTVLLAVKAYGRINRIEGYQIENDKRKVKKALREAVEGGWLTQTGKTFSITDKVYNELPATAPNLTAKWDESRKSWNRFNMPWLVFDFLTPGEMKWLLDNHDKYTWLLVNNNPIQYSGYKFETGDIDGPLTLAQIPEKYRAHAHDWKIAVQTDYLVEHCNTTMAEERFKHLYAHNLKWGLVEAGIITEDEAKQVKDGDDTSFPFAGVNTGFIDLGIDPDKWNQAAVESYVTSLANRVAALQTRLLILTKIGHNVADWNEFKRQYAAKLRVEIARQS